VNEAIALWDEPLPKAERDALIEGVADAVARRGLQTPALFALEIHRPVTFVASQALIVLGPLVGPLVGLDRMQNAARLLREPGVIDELIARIEATTRGPGRGDAPDERRSRGDAPSDDEERN
jgi:hypothetical protein